jgi:hypothetical protein
LCAAAFTSADLPERAGFFDGIEALLRTWGCEVVRSKADAHPGIRDRRS